MSTTSDRVESYAQAFLEVARAEGHLAEVEDELFRFANAYTESDELRLALTDPGLPVDRKVAVIQDLLQRKSLAVSQALVLAAVVAGRAGELEQIVARFVQLAVAERAHELAEVRSAVPLSDAVVAGRAGELEQIVARFVELAVAERAHELAEVRSAVPLSEADVARLQEALSRSTRKNVEVKVVIDPDVMGGIVTKVGDLVIDGSVRHRLDQLREQI